MEPSVIDPNARASFPSPQRRDNEVWVAGRSPCCAAGTIPCSANDVNCCFPDQPWQRTNGFLVAIVLQLLAVNHELRNEPRYGSLGECSRPKRSLDLTYAELSRTLAVSKGRFALAKSTSVKKKVGKGSGGFEGVWSHVLRSKRPALLPCRKFRSEPWAGQSPFPVEVRPVRPSQPIC